MTPTLHAASSGRPTTQRPNVAPPSLRARPRSHTAFRRVVFLLAPLSLAGCGPDQPEDVRGPATPVGGAYYLEAADGTRLAADVYHPAESPGPFPTLLTLTRYRRGLENASGRPIPTLSPLDRHFLSHGYALVKVDARGSGASFGSRPVEYGRQEVLDGYDVVQWVVSQDWSDGNVGAYGTSYTGTTAELLAAVDHPAVKAVVPGWSDFDAYASPVRPYGLLAGGFIDTWSELVGAMDRNDREALGNGVRRVDADRNGQLLSETVAAHAANPDVARMARRAVFRDDTLAAGQTWASIGPLNWKEAIERAGTPMLVLVSWLDAGTVEGAIQRFTTFSNPQKVIIMASNHGGAYHASPYAVSDEPLPPVPSTEEQAELRRLFFDHHLKGLENGVESWPALRFYNLGEEAFHEAEEWPIPGTALRTFYLDGGARLSPESAVPEEGVEEYSVDPGVTTGANNRWMTQMGEPILNLDDRAGMDARMLTYTSDPLPGDLQIAGTPVITLTMSADGEDGSVFVYLEDVDPEGRSRYVTEGGLRLLHRATTANPHGESEAPYRSYTGAAATPMVPDSVETVDIALWPIAARIRSGHRLRIAIAGADAGMFDPLPDGAQAFQVHRGGESASRIRIPVVGRTLSPPLDGVLPARPDSS